MQILKEIVVPDIATLDEMCTLQEIHIYLVDLGRGNAQNSRFVVRCRNGLGLTLDAIVGINLSGPNSVSTMVAYLNNVHAPFLELTPAMCTDTSECTFAYLAGT